MRETVGQTERKRGKEKEKRDKNIIIQIFVYNELKKRGDPF